MTRIGALMVALTVICSLAVATGVGVAVEKPMAASSATATDPSVAPIDDVSLGRSGPNDSTTTGPRIEAVYPNPVAEQDVGEFVVVRLPPGTNGSNWSLADDERTIPLPNRTIGGRVALTAAPAHVENLTDYQALALSVRLGLANAGETVVLLHRGVPVASVTYRDAPEGELRTQAGWRPLGATDFPVVHTDGGPARVFALPDAPGPPVEALRSADERILLAGYTFTSRRIAAALIDATRRGVRVRVLVEGGPVGGMTRRQAALLNRLVRADIDVRVVGGPYARYSFHHAKYAVVDDSVLVLTENWKPSGTGGRSSRGWGVLLEDPEAAAALARVFRADAGWRDAIPWRTFREGQTFVTAEPAMGKYPTHFAPQNVTVRRAAVLVAPDNAERALVARLDAAEESIRVVQVTIGGPRQKLLRAAVRAAERGVRVRILLSSAWYVHEDNAWLVDYLNDRAARERLPLEARIADPRGRFEKIHAKGVIIDGETVIIGSLNWNDHATHENREVLVVLESPEAAWYFTRVFEADWGGTNSRLPVGVLFAAGALVLLAGVGARRIEFEHE